MGKDAGWKGFFSDDERYADVINGIGCKGKQVVKKEDLQEMDTQTGFLRGPKFIRKLPSLKKKNVKIRDCVRKVAFGINFMIVGIENQETIDYSIPLRSMSHDVGTYEKQAAKIRKEVRKNHKGLTAGEYLYGFRKDSRLYSSVTIVLYSGSKTWDGPRSLHEMLDFTDIPEEMQQMVADYKINLVEIRKLEDTSVFKTDVRHVFDFIRYSNDKRALKQLVENDDYYKNMEEDAFDVAVQYTNATELIEAKEYYEKEGVVDMCRALTELIEDGREEGRDEKLKELVEKKVRKGLSVPEIAEIFEESEMTIAEIVKKLQ
ncbi:MAG: Rpn family recombination-promoting nuclease/putative transposase [Tyzzerella sp.]|nr:Rpn family recombination-promoting nuclease/putative transposase [Tyzzerella sp.]